MKRIAVVAALFVLVGCASQVTQRVKLTAGASECQITEVRTSMLANSVVRVCWDKDGKVLLSSSGDGVAPVSVVTGAITAGAIVGAGVAVGRGVSKVKTSTSVTVPEINIPGMP